VIAVQEELLQHRRSSQPPLFAALPAPNPVGLIRLYSLDQMQLLEKQLKHSQVLVGLLCCLPSQ
jgi:hypothetical protein